MDSGDGNGNELGIPGLSDMEQIAVGGSAVVYRARDVRHSRAVAVKVLNIEQFDARAHLAFEREVAAMGILSAHPNIIDLYDSGTTDAQRPYIVMPFYRRGNYAALVDQHGPLPWPELLDFGVKIAAALETAHRQDVVHRDVKPANIYRSDFDRHPVLADFGISSFAAPSLDGTPTVEVSTTPIYAAPEVLEANRPGVLSDIYSLGATLFALAEGKAAFSNPSLEVVVYQVTSAKSPPRPSETMPDPLADLISAMMQPDPERRPPAALAVAERLATIQKQQGLDPTPIVVGPEQTVGVAAQPPAATAEPETRVVPEPDVQPQPMEQVQPQPSAIRTPGHQTRPLSELDRPTEPAAELPEPPRPSRIGAPRTRPGWGGALILAAVGLVAAAGYAVVTGTVNLGAADGEEVTVLAGGGNEEARRRQIDGWAASGPPASHWVAHTPSWATATAWDPVPDGATRILATSGNDGVIRLWRDGSEATALDQIQLPDWIIDIAWSPDGSALAAAMVDGSVHLVAIDRNTNSTEVSFDREAAVVIAAAHSGGSEAVAWSPDGRRLVTGGVDAMVRMWTAEGDALADLSGHRGTVLSVDWSADGRRIASSAKDGRVIVWDASEHTMVAEIGRAEQEWTRAVEWAVDSRLLVATEETGQVTLWSTGEGKNESGDGGDEGSLTELKRFAVGGAPLASDFSPTPAPLLATVHEGGLVQIWDLATGDLVTEPEGGGSSDAVGVDWRPDGQGLAVVEIDGSALIWRPGSADGGG